jgi:glycosyltransferase involved in cell wall biosynthesis
LTARCEALRNENDELQRYKENLLKNRIRKIFKKCGKGIFEDDKSLRSRVLKQSEPTQLPINNDHIDPSQKKFLMICHDQNIDRRIIQEALLLQNQGWRGTIIALSFDNNDAFEIIDGISIHRIGLAHVVPDCPTYWRYQNRMRLISWWGRSTDLLHRLNWIVYGFDRVIKYRNFSAFAPLPFDYAFYNAGKHYPSDLVEAHDLPALKIASQLSEKWGVPLIYDAHELYYEQNVFSKIQKKMMHDLEQEYIHKCSAVFTVNESIALEMGQRYACKKPYVLVNAIDQPVGFNPVEKQNRIREYFTIPKSSPVILYQGGLSFLRNLENLALSMKYIKNPDAVLIFMGDGPAREVLGKIVEKNHLSKRVFFKNAVPQAELLSWTISADIGVIPYPPVDLNSYLCTPNKLFEYMQAGLPMVANDLPELRRFVKETGFGWTAQFTTPNKIARALDAALSDPEGLQKIRSNLLQQNGKYTWTCMSQIYLSVVNDVMKTQDSNN